MHHQMNLSAMTQREQPPSRQRLSPISAVAILGVGLVGELFLSELSRVQGLRIAGIGREGQRERLTQAFPGFDFSTSITDLETPPPELLILAVANPVDEAVREIAAFCAGSASLPIVVLIQNGVDVVPQARKAFSRAPSPNLLRGSLFTVVTREPETGEPVYSQNKLRIALAQVCGEGMKESVALCQQAGFEVEICPDYQSMEWSKLLINTIGTTGTITRLALAQTLEDDALFHVELQALRDRLAVLRAAKIPLVDFWRLRLPVRMLSQIVTKAPRFLFRLFQGRMAETIARERGRFPPSSARRIAEGRTTEVDFYHGPFIRLGKEVGRRSSVDEAILKVVHLHREGRLDLRELSPRERRQTLFEQIASLSEQFSPDERTDF